MTRRVGSLAVVLLLVFGATACTPTSGHKVGGPAKPRVKITRIAPVYATNYDSIFSLRADTKVAVIATAQSVAPDPASNTSMPASFVTMRVVRSLRGTPGHQFVVYEIGGQPGDVVSGQVPIRVGHTYLMLLGFNAHTGEYSVLNGITGLFSYDPKTQVATRLDPLATGIPHSVSLDLVESFLGTSSPTSRALASEPPIPLPDKPLPPVAGACPPGCSLPSDYDAITWLAAASESVTIVTARLVPPVKSKTPTDFTVDRTLEITGAQWRPVDPMGPLSFPTLVNGRQYLVFLSYWRGGPCISTFYGYDPQTQVASLLRSDRTVIPLPGRDLPVPQSITLAQVRERMYPTGPFVQSTDVSESMCPE